MRISVRFSMYLPEGTTHPEVEEWLRCQLDLSKDLSLPNSLAEKELATIGITDLAWMEV